MRVLRTALALIVLAGVAAPTTAGGFDRLLPEGTVLFVSMNDLTEMKAKVKDGPMGAFLEEKEVQEFLKLPRAAWAEAMKDAKAESGMSPDEFLDAIHGEVAFAITGMRRLDEDRQILGLVLLVDVGENEGKIRDLFARAEANEAMAKVRKVVTDARGAKIVSYIKKDDEDGLNKIEDDVYVGPPSYFLQDGLLAVASDVDALKGILARRGATETPSLATHTRYRNVREQTGARADMTVYVNMAPIWEFVKEKTADEPMAARVMEALGVFSMHGMGLSMEMTRDAVITRMFLDAPGDKRGLMRLFAAKNTALTPPKFVPTNAGSVMTMGLDLADLWAETRRVIGKIDAATLEQVDGALDGLKEQMGVDLVADVINSFGKEVSFYQLITDKKEGAMGFEAMMPNMVIAMKVTDAEALGFALDTLLENTPIPLAEEEYLGVKMRVMKEGPVNPAMAIVGGHLVFAGFAEDLQAVIRSAGKDVKGLVDSEAFARAMSRLPAERMMVSYSNPLLAHKTISDLLPNLPMDPDVADWVDLSLIPSWATFNKYFDVSGGVMISDERGLYSISRQELKTPK